jgi:hypothetical protein
MHHQPPQASGQHFRSPLPSAHTHQPIPQRNERPSYAIIAAMPNHKPREIGRTCNRADAEDTVRFLQRRVKDGRFYVVFDPADTNNEGNN